MARQGLPWRIKYKVETGAAGKLAAICAALAWPEPQFIEMRQNVPGEC